MTPSLLERGLAMAFTQQPLPPPYSSGGSQLPGAKPGAHLSVVDINSNTVSYVPLSNLTKLVPKYFWVQWFGSLSF